MIMARPCGTTLNGTMAARTSAPGKTQRKVAAFATPF